MAKKAPCVATFPFLEAQWDYARNTEDIHVVSSASSVAVYWRCKICGYDWTATPKARYRASGRCPCCQSGKVIRRGVNDVFTLVPELIESYDFEKNGDFDIYSEGLDSSKKVFWKCSLCGRSWATTIRARIKRVDGQYAAVPCPHYNTVKRKACDVPAISNVPSLIKFWDHNKNHLDPYTTRSNSTERAAWICGKCGYMRKGSIASQATASGKCACCELRLVKKAGAPDPFTIVPDLKKTYDFQKTLELISANSASVIIAFCCGGSALIVIMNGRHPFLRE